MWEAIHCVVPSLILKKTEKEILSIVKTTSIRSTIHPFQITMATKGQRVRDPREREDIIQEDHLNGASV